MFELGSPGPKPGSIAKLTHSPGSFPTNFSGFIKLWFGGLSSLDAGYLFSVVDSECVFSGFFCHAQNFYFGVVLTSCVFWDCSQLSVQSDQDAWFRVCGARLKALCSLLKTPFWGSFKKECRLFEISWQSLLSRGMTSRNS